MASRRPRNEISRNRDMALAAADLYDQGLTDIQVAAALSKQFEIKVSARTANSFYKAEYEPIQKKRLSRREAARKVDLVLSGAAGTYAQAGQELLARMLYDILEDGGDIEAKELIGAGKTFAKIRELDIAEMKARYEMEMKRRAEDAVKAGSDEKLTPAEREQKMKEALGIA